MYEKQLPQRIARQILIAQFAGQTKLNDTIDRIKCWKVTNRVLISYRNIAYDCSRKKSIRNTSAMIVKIITIQLIRFYAVHITNVLRKCAFRSVLRVLFQVRFTGL